jgi:hypothetical protein
MLSGVLALVFGLFLLIKQKLRPNGAFARLAAASAGAGALFLAWAFVLQSRRGDVQSTLGWVMGFSTGRFQWTSAKQAFRVADLAGLDLFGLWQGFPGLSKVLLIQWLATLALLAGTLRLAQDRRRDAAWFSAAMALSISLPLFLMDFFSGSTSGRALRYAGPSAIGWLLMLVFMAAWLVSGTGKRRLAGYSAVAAYIIVAAISAVSTHNSRITPAKGFHPLESIDFLNSTDRITLVSDEFVGDMLALAQNVRPDLPVVWTPRCFTCARALIPEAEIPAEAPRTGEVVYIRSWVSTWPPARFLGLASDQFDDPRFHTKPVLVSGLSGELFQSPDLFWLTPRESSH